MANIFTRLGLWQEDIRSNLDAEASAREFTVRNHLSGVWDEQFHAMDYLAYAYLQGAQDKQAWGVRTGVAVDIVTQFCFEAPPLLDWLAALRGHGVALPVHIGLAGPASPATLLKFALRCGVGNSLRALRSQIGRFGRLLTDSDPGAVVRGLAGAPAAATAQIAGFHLFPFGGLRKSGLWLKATQGADAMSEAHG